VGTWNLACRATVQENPEGHLSGRRQGGPVCASAGAEERSFCGPWLGAGDENVCGRALVPLLQQQSGGQGIPWFP
jgi:hypothetical protein